MKINQHKQIGRVIEAKQTAFIILCGFYSTAVCVS